MNTFVKGILVGVGVGVLVAPFSGEETRRLLNERYREWRNSLPEDSRVNQYAQQVSERVAHTKDNLQHYAGDAVSKMKDSRNTLGNKAQQYADQAVSKVKDSGNTLGNKAQQYAGQARHTSQEAVNKAKHGSPDINTKITPETDKSLPQDY